MALTKCAKLKELSAESGSFVTMGGKDIALFHIGGKVYACSNTCAHQGGPLAEGSLKGTVVSCPWHNWQYDVTTGKCLVNPSIQIPTFKTKVEGDDVYVDI
ncbi:MAG TPA: nitrite reductase small subunit NirD [Bdellovibrionota bacterium]|nr:nitrite reductase small subunit NirD [Bdellovibrionota bacterium]